MELFSDYSTLWFIGVVAVLYLVFQAYSRWKNRGSYPKNPFLEGRNDFKKYVKSLPVHPISPNKIEEIITRSVKSHMEATKKKYDVIVIGSGISGLVASGILARSGKKVLLLEQHDRFGGLSHCFEEKGYKFCVGIHFCAELTPDINLVTEKLLKLEPICTPERFDLGSETFSINESEWEPLKTNIIAEFPKEKENLTKFFDFMARIKDSGSCFILGHYFPFYIRFMWFFQRKSDKLYKEHEHSTTDAILDSFGIKDEALRWFLRDSILMYYDPNYISYKGTRTAKNFALHSRYNSLLLKKKKAIIGPYGYGGDNFAKIIIPNLIAMGGEALCSAKVGKILLDPKSQKVTGVELDDESKTKIHASHVINSAGVKNLVEMLPERVSEKTIFRRLLADIPYSGYFFVVFLGFPFAPSDLGLKNSIHYLQASKKKNLHEDFLGLKGPKFDGFEDCYMMGLFLVDSMEEERINNNIRENNKKKTSLQILVPANPEWFKKYEKMTSKKRGREYEEVKSNLLDKVLRVLYQKYPELEDKADYVDSGTNASFEYYGNLPRGAGYSLCLSPEKLRFVLEKKKEVMNPVSNLFNVGGDTYSPGIGGQMMSCLYSCGKILGRDLFIDMLRGEYDKSKKAVTKKEK